MQAVELQHGPWRLALRADMGGCIAGLWRSGVAVLRSTAPAELASVRASGSYPLVPFSNRIAQARLQWNGTSHPLVQNFAGEEHSIHGLGWQRPWEVLDASDHFAMLSLEHKSGAAWPFAFDCSQTFRLSDAGLEMTLSMTNQSATPAPAGLGWHPYFVKRAGSRIAFDATGRWEMGRDKLPTVLASSTGIQQDVALLEVDNCFEGWSGAVQLHDELLHTRIASNLNRVVVFTGPGKDFVCVEPVSHANNAMNMLATNDHSTSAPDALGIKILEPGESWSVQMEIHSEPAH